jgi:hypothetical protein
MSWLAGGQREIRGRRFSGLIEDLRELTLESPACRQRGKKMSVLLTSRVN